MKIPKLRRSLAIYALALVRALFNPEQLRYFSRMSASASTLSGARKLGLRVEDFLLLNDSGAFRDYAKTELIDGDIYVSGPRFAPQARTKSRLALALATRLAELGGDLEAIIGVSVRLNEDSVPRPDIVLTRWRGGGLIPVESVALVIEVSDTTLETDLGRKSDLYAAAGIPEYWVIDLNEGRALMHELPDADGYHGQLDILLNERLASATIDGLEVEGAKLLG